MLVGVIMLIVIVNKKIEVLGLKPLIDFSFKIN
jgi:hypothetical protein